ncbi:MAG: hypothetical protein ACPG32_15890 [Akkermansiaceae bacterium]
MKLTITLATSVAAFGLALMPLHAENAATKEKAAPAAVAAKTTPVYVIQVSGKG